MPGEFDLIDWIRNRVRTDSRVPIGIGDDAAVLGALGERRPVVTKDVLLEGVHFDRRTATAREIGRKAVAVNLSDIAAMAAEPVAAVVGLVLPRGIGDEFPRELVDGAVTVAESNGCLVVGGDVNSWDGPLAVSVTLIGAETERGVVTRSGARPGDVIFVTGALGGSLPSGRHYWFQPRVPEALALHAAFDLHAMIDVSDGLAADLGHILDESRVGAILEAEAIPISDDAVADERTPLEHALGDGEDFELVFTVAAEDAERLQSTTPIETDLKRIGEITESRDLLLAHPNGETKPLPRSGWQHHL